MVSTDMSKNCFVRTQTERRIQISVRLKDISAWKLLNSVSASDLPELQDSGRKGSGAAGVKVTRTTQNLQGRISADTDLRSALRPLSLGF